MEMVYSVEPLMVEYMVSSMKMLYSVEPLMVE
jgi:hypothetical protein